MVVEFLNVLDCYANDEPITITNERIMDLWEQVLPLLESDRDKYTHKASTSRTNGKLGGRPKKNNNPTEPTETQQVLDKPKLTYHNLNNPIDIDIDNDIDIEKDIENEIIEVLNTGAKNERLHFYTKHKNDIEFIMTTLEIDVIEAMNIHRENLELNVFNNL
jgi:hypothetical protein